MKLTVRNGDFNDDANREKLARFLQATIDADKNCRFEPHRASPHDSARWKIDENNNWFLSFSDDDPNTFEIRHRYQSEATPYEEALAAWLAYRIDARVVDKN